MNKVAYKLGINLVKQSFSARDVLTDKAILGSLLGAGGGLVDAILEKPEDHKNESFAHSVLRHMLLGGAAVGAIGRGYDYYQQKKNPGMNVNTTYDSIGNNINNLRSLGTMASALDSFSKTFRRKT